jgi:hypothetical protein
LHGGACRRKALGAAHHGLDPRQQFSGVERLGQEAISSEISSATVVILNPSAMLRQGGDAIAPAPLGDRSSQLFSEGIGMHGISSSESSGSLLETAAERAKKLPGGFGALRVDPIQRGTWVGLTENQRSGHNSVCARLSQ